MEQVIVEAMTVTSSPSAAAYGSQPSAVAWGAIIAGAVAAIATSMVLIALGTGIGLTTLSPWNGEGISAKSIGIAALIWLIIVQWLSAGLGGYLTGRLRLRWTAFTHDEVFFRDTAHGFLSWAAAIAVVVVAAGTIATLSPAGTARHAMTGSAATDSLGYFADTLYRTNAGNSENALVVARAATAEDVRGETSRILARNLAGNVNPDDSAYLTHVVAARTGMSQNDARMRVDQVIASAKQAADEARKSAATASIATAISLAIGGFIAAVAAGLGGRLRDT